ncbi:RNA ligase family protein [Nannocystis pusilla]|uniref:RNA ligase family protein n=1 Tax=Nannocystis pusilla TaxID=889268 RepID=UPI003DA52F21
MTPPILKYPRTQHLEGSRFQHGDHDLDAVPFRDVRGRFVVVEEKMDGGNAGISFDGSGQLLLQSRGHYLTGGGRERHFDLLKRWANTHADDLYLALGERYVMYGEWMYAKHTCFYDALPHYFMEFDILDRETGEFLSTARRREMLHGLPVVSVEVLWEGHPERLTDITRLVGPSRFKTPQWRDRLIAAGEASGVAPAQVVAETDGFDDMEGLYIKVEEEGRVTARLKWVRASFLNAILDSGSHWLDRPIVPNQLADGVDLWAPA